MAAKLTITPEVMQDLDEAYAWYETQRFGLGEEYLSCIDACLETIGRSPDLFEVVHEHYRRALVRRFPYAIFFEAIAHQITIYGVFHTARDPWKWKGRLP
ncbi:MAG TPA: type II toxin-antitoxin system RelE/ParE family toxin [Planctomicrobium sp.]|nr:type II toxin-antitoxin system RelE/ParE family toxin [Planctomicrobium sp.]